LSQKVLSATSADQQRLLAFGLDGVRSDLGVLGFLQIDDGDLRPLAREQHGAGAANAGITAGDDRHLVLEAAIARELRHVVGLGVHLGLATGLVVLVLGRIDLVAVVAGHGGPR
jgi:hypothetical protein